MKTTIEDIEKLYKGAPFAKGSVIVSVVEAKQMMTGVSPERIRWKKLEGKKIIVTDMRRIGFNIAFRLEKIA